MINKETLHWLKKSLPSQGVYSELYDWSRNGAAFFPTPRFEEPHHWEVVVRTDDEHLTSFEFFAYDDAIKAQQQLSDELRIAKS